MSNLEIREFQKAIIDFSNSSLLPIEVKRLAMVEILMKMDAESSEVIKAEIIDREKGDQQHE